MPINANFYIGGLFDNYLNIWSKYIIDHVWVYIQYIKIFKENPRIQKESLYFTGKNQHQVKSYHLIILKGRHWSQIFLYS